MGWVFLFCGLMLCMVNLMAGAAFLLPAAAIFWFAPKWNLRIEVGEKSFRFSENVVETFALELPFSDIAEIRHVEESEQRKGFLTTYPEFYPFVEFVTRAGKIHRMHDIFGAAFDAELKAVCDVSGIPFLGLSRDEGEAG